MTQLKTYLEAHQFETLLKDKVDPQVSITELVRCKNGQGRPFFAYIQIKPSQYMDYKLKLERGEPVNPNEYEIVEYGWGENPPLHLQEAMEQKVGIDNDFEKKIQQLQKDALEKVAG